MIATANPIYRKDKGVANALMHNPLSVYINWAAYDELSDNQELTEELAMQQLDELLRLRARGVRFDYYLMDCFWFAPDGAYREWRKPHWPHGPDRWLNTCLSNGVLPGLWVATNTLPGLIPPPAWEDSLNRRRTAMCLYRGGYLADFMDMFQRWYDRGVRMFKFDFTDLGAATPEAELAHLPEEIKAMNSAALRAVMVAFRQRNPEVRFLAYNGFGGDQSNTSLPYRKTVDLRWLDAFDALYCGDPRPSDVPAMNFWRSKDIYSDHMVRQYERNGVPLERIDNTSFMIGTTGTCYRRRTAAWQGMLILSLARGGWMNTYYGNLELLDDEKAAWFARVQQLFLTLQATGRIFTFGGVPGEGRPYGYAALNQAGALYTVVNPTQAVAPVVLPRVSAFQAPPSDGRMLFHDAGYRPGLADNCLTLGPEQMAVVGTGKFAAGEYDLGVQEDVVIPASIETLDAAFEPAGHNRIAATLPAPAGSDLRVIMTQAHNGIAQRTTGGAPPDGHTLGTLLRIDVEQEGTLPVTIQYDKAIWSGLSWAAGEVRATQMQAGVPIRVVCTSAEEKPLDLSGTLYRVRYA